MIFKTGFVLTVYLNLARCPMEELLNRIMDNCREYTGQGKVADYIPALAMANPDDFGICLFQ